jgi:hypothetical protein
MNTRKSLASILATLAFIGPSSAWASWNAYPASACTTEGDNSDDYFFSGMAIQNFSDGWGARARLIHCPVESTTAYPSQNITAGVINVFDRNSNSGHDVRAWVCFTNASATDMGCSTAASTNGNQGFNALNLTGPDTQTSTALWVLHNKVGGYFIEMQAELPQFGDFGASSLNSYVFTVSPNVL